MQRFVHFFARCQCCNEGNIKVIHNYAAYCEIVAIHNYLSKVSIYLNGVDEIIVVIILIGFSDF